MEEITNQKIEKYISKEVKFVLTVLSIAASIAVPFWKIQIDISNINRDLSYHVSLQEEELTNIRKDIVRLEEKDKSQDIVDEKLMSRIADLKK